MSDPRQQVIIEYTNYRGERALRRIRPLRIDFENNEWHPETQWLLLAVDLDKNEERTFALKNIHSWFFPAWDRYAADAAALSSQLPASERE